MYSRKSVKNGDGRQVVREGRGGYMCVATKYRKSGGRELVLGRGERASGNGGGKVSYGGIGEGSELQRPALFPLRFLIRWHSFAL